MRLDNYRQLCEGPVLAEDYLPLSCDRGPVRALLGLCSINSERQLST